MQLSPARTEEYVDLAAFKQQFDERLTLFIAKKVASARLQTNSAEISEYIAHAGTLALAGGKRVRPYLAYTGYLLADGIDAQAVLDALVGLELFHIFTLIHDDIIDRGSERHGLPTLQHVARPRISDTQCAERVGEAQAILLGDLVFAWAQEALFSATPVERAVSVRTLFNQMVEEVVIGQMIDVSLMARTRATLAEIEEKNRLKTSCYTFVSPLKVGAALASPSKKYDAFFETFGTALGSAYQIQDDLLDIVGNPQKTGKETFVDLQAGQHTFFTQYIFDTGAEHEKKQLASLFGRPLSQDQRAEALALFTQSGSLSAGKKRAAQELNHAESVLMSTDVPPPHAHALHTLIETIRNRVS